MKRVARQSRECFSLAQLRGGQASPRALDSLQPIAAGPSAEKKAYSNNQSINPSISLAPSLRAAQH